MKKLLCILVLGVCMMQAAAAKDAPWWEKEKVRFFWGQWARSMPTVYQTNPDGKSWEEMMQNLSTCGVTVFVTDNRCKPWTESGLPPVSLADKYGIHYFVQFNGREIQNVGLRAKARLAVNKSGLTSYEEFDRGMYFQDPSNVFVACPLDETAVEEWLFKPLLQMVKSGVVDGCHIDWEPYGAGRFDLPNDTLCYCDDCFSRYASAKGIAGNVARAERYDLLQKKGLLRDYLSFQRDRVADLYRKGAERVRKIKSDFIFSAYWGFTPDDLENSWRMDGSARGLHSASAPFFIIDSSYYGPSHRVPCWETSYDAVRKLGMKHILGTWTGEVYGETPTFGISVTQWAYEAAMSHDGYWIWFEHPWGPNDYRVFNTADKMIRTVESKVGDLLLTGAQDDRFACLVEQSGDPVLGRNVVQRSYHLGERHLVRVSNGNTDIPVQVLVRLGRLTGNGSWLVTDPISGLHYTHSGSAVWRSTDINRGVHIALDKRSDAWILVSPVAATKTVNRELTISADVPEGHPDRLKTEGPAPKGSAPVEGFPLVYVKTNPLIYHGLLIEQGVLPVMGSSIHYIDANGSGGDAKQLFANKGNCWSPMLSPDRRKVAFASYVNGKGQIYVVNADGSSPMNVSGNDFCDNSPVWSPDGSKIAFVSDRDGDWELYVMNADGSGQRRLTKSDGVDRAPAWSPDGKQIAFESDRNGNFDIYVIGADGLRERRLNARPENQYEPKWSPDGRYIACTIVAMNINKDVLVLDAADGSTKNPRGIIFAAKGDVACTDVYSIAWSPDGTQIAGVFEGNVDRRLGVFTVNVAGKDMRHVVVGELLKPYAGGVATGHNVMGGWYQNGSASRRWIPSTFSDVSWSPDGSRLSFCSDIGDTGYFFRYTVGSDGRGLTRLEPTFSPDGPFNKPEPIRGASIGTPKASEFAASAPQIARYVDGLDYRTFVTGLRQLAELPVDGWAFKDDPNGTGADEGCFRTDYKDTALPKISVDKVWDAQGFPSKMANGWYRLRWKCPEIPEGKRVFLNFGGVDESCWLYIDGKLTAWYDSADPGRTWDQPFLLEVTSSLKSGREHLLALRVHNWAHAGGIYKPVSLMVEK